MTRQSPSVGGGAVATRRERSDVVTASAPGYADVGRFAVGRYENLTNGGKNVQPQQDTVDMTTVPPGNSFNSDHYAKEWDESKSNASSELLGASVTMLGEMRSGFTTEFSWTNPAGDVIWSGSASIDDPSTEDCGGDPCEWWENAWFYTWIGRGFGEGGSAEIVQPGDYTVSFFNPYIDVDKSVTVTGAYVDSCSTPAQVPAGGTAEIEATVKAPQSSYNTSGKVVAIETMTDQLTERRKLGEASYSIGGVNNPQDDVVVDVPANAIGSPGDNISLSLYTLS
jgi:hypothetical protein